VQQQQQQQQQRKRDYHDALWELLPKQNWDAPTVVNNPLILYIIKLCVSL
jgi:hypothetical protein